MNSLVKYMFCGECNITMDTENFMNKVHEVMNSLVKYMIWGECNTIIETVSYMNLVHDDMNFMVKWVSNIVLTLRPVIGRAVI